MLTLEQWEIERAKLEQAQEDIQGVIDTINASYGGGGSVAWSRVGVVNNPTYSNGDLTVAATGVHALRSSVSPALSKRFFRTNVDVVGNAGYLAIGLIRDDQSIATPPNSLASVPAGMWLWRSDTYKVNNGQSSQVGSSWGSGDNIDVAVDEQGRAWFARNGTWIQGDPVAGTNPVFTGLTGNIGACLVFMGANGSPRVTGVFDGVTAPAGFSLMGVE